MMESTVTPPYWRLSGFYLFYFASLGTLLPFMGLYLQTLDFTLSEIGEVMALIMGTKIIAPNIWGWIADKTGRSMVIVKIASLLSLLAFIGVFFGNSYAWIMTVMFVFSFFWNANLPQFEVTTLNHLGNDTHKYSRIRLWGSIGFIIAVVTLGRVFEIYGAESFPYIVFALLGSIWLSSLFIPEAKKRRVLTSTDSFFSVVCKPGVIALFLVFFLLQASHGPYYVFFTIYLESNGYTRSAIGFYWALGVLAEIIVFMLMVKWLPRFGARNLMLWVAFLTALRWVLLASFVDSHLIIFFSQLLHAASFGVFHAVAINLIHQHFPGKLQGRGQAIYSSLSFGAGGAVGALYAGYLWASYGASVSYYFAAVLCLLAAVVIIIAWERMTAQSDKIAGELRK